MKNKHKELVAQYGESRTKLAATVSNSVIAVLGDAVEIGGKALAGGPGGPFGSRAGMAMALAKQAAEPAPDPDAGNIANLPRMNLEKMDQTMTSVRQLTIGFKSMMEGMSGLQDLKPPEEPRPQPMPKDQPPD